MAQLVPDLTLQDSDGNTALHKAFEERNFKLMDSLLAAHININSNPTNAVGISHFHIACARNNENVVKHFLKNGVSVNICVPTDPNIEYKSYWDDIDWRGCSPLHFAAAFNMSKIVSLLLSEKASVKIQDARGFTAFHLACRNMLEKFEELIMENLQKLDGVNVVGPKVRVKANKIFDIENAMGSLLARDICSHKQKVIDWKSNRKDHLDIMKVLLEYKSDVNSHDKFGNTPLFYAYVYYALDDSILQDLPTARNDFLMEMLERRPIILKMLLRHKVDLDTCCSNGSILLFMMKESVESESLSGYCEMEILKLFLRKRLNVDVLNEKKVTPLFQAVQSTSRTDFITLFIQYGADVNFHDPEKGSTPLHAALENPFDKEQLILDAVLDGGADPNAKQLDGTTVLHYLAGEFYYYPNIFSKLIGAGADIEARDAKGQTPLFRACLFWNKGLAKMLLKAGADINAEDNEGKTVLCAVYEEKLVKSKDGIGKMTQRILGLLLDHVEKKKATVSQKVLLSREKIMGHIGPGTPMEISDSDSDSEPDAAAESDSDCCSDFD